MMRHEGLTIDVQVTCGGENLFFCRIISGLDLADVMPMRPSPDPMDMMRFQQALERRRHLINAIAEQFAHTIVEAIYKKAAER
jgi:hypothetical protein